jgi:hypothetical protein
MGLQVKQPLAGNVAHDLACHPVEGTRLRAGDEPLDVIAGARHVEVRPPVPQPQIGSNLFAHR